jgi:2-dehydro-3-deoxy-D-arabinonate dehydratase
MSGPVSASIVEGLLMQLCKVRLSSGEVRAGVLAEGAVRLFARGPAGSFPTLADIFHASDPAAAAGGAPQESPVPLAAVTLLAPIDEQEVWAAGVTYKRSREARERESVGAARFYDLVYTAARPELFFKATPHRVVGPGERVRIRRDSRWSVPEPEIALVISPRLEIVGFTIGNDMSARDIEGENPLYLPQAKVYTACCALGPAITLAGVLPPAEQMTVRLAIERSGATVFEGTTSAAAMARSFADLVDWLGRDNSFPSGVILLTGTGIVPPDHFSLAAGDVVTIAVAGIGTLSNVVEQEA